MKAILVIDLPVALDYLIDEGEVLLYISHIDNRYIMTEIAKIRPLPQRMSWGHTADYIEGYNACLEEITGETE